MIGMGVVGPLIGNSIAYHQGRDGVLAGLLFFWGGILMAVVGYVWFLVTIFRREESSAHPLPDETDPDSA
jgi:hypothetical protein